MNHNSILVSDSFDRVSMYFTTTPPWTSITTAPANVATQIKALDDIRATLQAHATDQASGQNTTRHQAAVVQSLRRLLRADHLMPIRHIARAMLADQVGVVHQFDLPSKRSNTKRLLQAARQVAQDAVPYQSVLIANGRPADFLDQLNIAIAALETASGAQETGASLRSKASAGIAETIRKGRQAVQYLDAIMRSCFGNSPEIMAQWRQAKRIRQSTSPVTAVKPVTSASSTVSKTAGGASSAQTTTGIVNNPVTGQPTGTGVTPATGSTSQDKAAS